MCKALWDYMKQKSKSCGGVGCCSVVYILVGLKKMGIAVMISIEFTSLYVHSPTAVNPVHTIHWR